MPTPRDWQKIVTTTSGQVQAVSAGKHRTTTPKIGNKDTPQAGTTGGGQAAIVEIMDSSGRGATTTNNNKVFTFGTQRNTNGTGMIATSNPNHNRNPGDLRSPATPSAKSIRWKWMQVVAKKIFNMWAVDLRHRAGVKAQTAGGLAVQLRRAPGGQPRHSNQPLTMPKVYLTVTVVVSE